MRCVITGAADGIGRALAERFGRADYAVTGVDVDEQRSKQTRDELKALGIDIRFVIGDLVDPVDTRRCVEAVCEGGAIQVLIHNAGISAAGRFQTIPLEVQLRVIDLNLIAPMVVTPALLRAGKLTSSASIVFVSSLSHFVGYPGVSVYAATKDGIASYARSLRVSLGKKRHVLTVFPGPTRTEHARRYSPDNSRESKRMPPDVLADLIYRSVLKRRKRLIPGLTNKIISRMGNLFPVFTERMMAKTMLRPGE